MKTRTASCPSCGGPVEFHISTSLVTICQFCNSAVARSDKSVEDHGKVADLIATDSPLQRGMRGKYGGKSFEVLGRVQYQHPAGGTWDEWYLAFPGDRWGWLSESQGQRHLSFEKRLKKSASLPSFASLDVGTTFDIRDQQLTVSEKGVARTLSAEGEIPWNFIPNQEHTFADLRGPEGVFATFEYGEEDGDRFFLGQEVELEDLHLEGQGWETRSDTVRVGALALNCPQCGGPISLRVPDKTERIYCDNCHALLDAAQGKLEYFKTVDAQKVHPKLPLGAEGKLFGRTYTVIGFLARYAMYEGQRYPWSEFLLYDDQDGSFRWLVYNDRHWMFAEPVSVGEVQTGPTKVRYKGTSFRVFDRGTAHVRYVLGEFYWKVQVGERAATADYIAPPHMLCFERSQQGENAEQQVTRGTYLPVEDVETAFGVESLPRPWGVAPSQPAPRIDWRVFMAWPIFSAILVLLFFVWNTSSPKSGSDPLLLALALLGVASFPLGVMLYRHNFEVQRWKDSDYSPYSSD